MTVGDRIRIEAQIAILKEIAIDYKGKTIDNIIQAARAEIGRFKSETN